MRLLTRFAASAISVFALWSTPLFAQEANTIELPAGVEQRGMRLVSQKDDMELRLVSAGAFVMGSPDGGFDERPAHQVYLDAFLIDVHEVTNVQFERFLRESNYKPTGPWKRGYQEGQENFPVRFVTWYDAKAYAKWAGRDLPSEAMWEKAARGPRGYVYPWGAAWRTGMAQTNAEVAAGPAQVGSYPDGKSPYGCYDMGGNVWEWVDDWYDRFYYESLPSDNIVRNPTGPEDGAQPEQRFIDTNTAAGNERSTRKVIRGGGWAGDGQEHARCANRNWGNPHYWLNDTGFRCAIRLDAR